MRLIKPLKFLNHVSKKRDGGPFGEPVEGDIPAAWKHVGAYISAIKWKHRERHLEINHKHVKTMTDFVKGHKARIAIAKQDGRMSMTEGTNQLTYKSCMYMYVYV
jgi:hypothetical protein